MNLIKIIFNFIDNSLKYKYFIASFEKKITFVNNNSPLLWNTTT